MLIPYRKMLITKLVGRGVHPGPVIGSVQRIISYSVTTAESRSRKQMSDFELLRMIRTWPVMCPVAEQFWSRPPSENQVLFGGDQSLRVVARPPLLRGFSRST